MDDTEQPATAIESLIDGYASAMDQVEQEFCCSQAESERLYAKVDAVIDAARAEVESLRTQLAAAQEQAAEWPSWTDVWCAEAERDVALADLAAVRTDLSVARAEIERLSMAYIEATNPGIDMELVRQMREANR